MDILRDGLGDGSEFRNYHPAVNLIFYIFVIGIAMFSTRPLFIAMAFVCSWAYSVILGGRKTMKMNIIFMVPIVLIMAVMNVFFSHNGDTVLMYINGNRITMEALYYGIASAMILTLVIVWFASFNIVMSADKIVYIFGKAAPVLGLTMSMIFRFIPLLKARYAEIHLGQQCMGRNAEKGIMRRAAQLLKEVSILISWSLESSIETADSMEARGYGLKGRSSFHLFVMTWKDKAAIIYMMVTGGMAAYGCIVGYTKMTYFPVLEMPGMDMMTIVTAFSYMALMMMPMVIDLKGERKWRQLELNI